MSKKKRSHTIKLEIGKFYRVLDGSPTGHPGQIYKIDFGNNTFYAIVTGSMTLNEFLIKGTRKGFIKLNVPTDGNVEISLVKKRPFIGERDDFGEKEYLDMKFDDSDRIILLSVKREILFSENIIRKGYKRKTPINGVHGLTVSRHQTSDDHDHASIKSNKFQICNKKAGGAQANHDIVKAAHNISTSTHIKANKRKGNN